MNLSFSNEHTGEKMREWQLEEEYQAFLNEVYGVIVIGAGSYDATSILKAIDPVTYRCGFADWMDAEGWVDA